MIAHFSGGHCPVIEAEDGSDYRIDPDRSDTEAGGHYRNVWVVSGTSIDGPR